MTVARQPGETAVSALKPSHILNNVHKADKVSTEGHGGTCIAPDQGEGLAEAIVSYVISCSYMIGS